MFWLILVLIALVVALLMYMLPLIQVCGDSMYPTFNDGDIILGCRLYHTKKESIYVYRPPLGEKYVIKRLKHINPSNPHKLFFEGDNSRNSYDSRMYGYVSQNKLVAKYVLTIYRRKEDDYNDC